MILIILYTVDVITSIYFSLSAEDDWEGSLEEEVLSALSDVALHLPMDSRQLLQTVNKTLPSPVQHNQITNLLQKFAVQLLIRYQQINITHLIPFHSIQSNPRIHSKNFFPIIFSLMGVTASKKKKCVMRAVSLKSFLQIIPNCWQ